MVFYDLFIVLFSIIITFKKNRLKADSSALHKSNVWLEDFPTREEQIEKMSQESEYDIVVIGGGATGCGVAVDAASRGIVMFNMKNMIHNR